MKNFYNCYFTGFENTKENKNTVIKSIQQNNLVTLFKL